MLGVGKFFHSLNGYVYEHWLDHLLALASKAQGSDYHHLQACLDSLWALLFRLSHEERWGSGGTRPISQQDVLASEPRLRYLEQYDPVYQLISLCVEHRQLQRTRFGQSDYAGKNHYRDKSRT